MKTLSKAQIDQALQHLKGWTYKDNAITANFEFNNFFEAFRFMIKVATAAEQAQHHPDWSNVYNKVHIKLSTHEAGGVTQADLDLAAAINEIQPTD